MAKKPIITIVVGTRPEAIKLAPLIIEARTHHVEFKTRVLLTGQHKEMVEKVFNFFDIAIDNNLNLMKPAQSLNYITCRSLEGIREDLKKNTPKMVFIQGDTTTAFSAALASFYEKIPVGHVEAGLRTESLFDPFPEEANRRLISQISSMHFAPTKQSKNNLIRAGVLGDIHVTGNTGIDSLLLASEKVDDFCLDSIDWDRQKIILTTIHRRENWGFGIKNVCLALIKILNKFSDVSLILPLHPNPEVQKDVKHYLGNHSRAVLLDALPYDQLVAVMKKCFLVITDSGGLQEEAPSFGKPVLVTRKTTERQEAVDAGTAKLVGIDTDFIVKEVENLIINQRTYNKMSKINNPFGDGKASKRIISEFLKKYNNLK